jgi:glutathione S-transferase
MKAADLKRARAVIQTERTRLSREWAAFNAERQSWGAERHRVVEALRIVTAHLDASDWQVGDDLADVIAHCVLGPLLAREDEQLRRLTEAQARIRELLVSLERAPARPVAVESRPDHPITAEAVGSNGVMLYRAHCGCGWRGSVARRAERAAVEDGAQHERSGRHAVS